MTEFPEIQTILKQFPWARIGKDGGFNFELTLAMRYLLGSGPNFGWWAMEEPDTGLRFVHNAAKENGMNFWSPTMLSFRSRCFLPSSQPFHHGPCYYPSNSRISTRA
jgi:hypothetical protein